MPRVKEKRPSTREALDLAAKALGKKVEAIGYVVDMAPIEYVPTCFVGLNRAVELGGWPRKGVSLVHGPNSAGKTALALGILDSFERFGHPAIYVDVERALDKDFALALAQQNPNIGYRKPRDLSDFELLVSGTLKAWTKAKVKDKHGKSKLPADMSSIWAVDTITKLIPPEMMEKIRKEGASAGYSAKAAAQTAWLTSLIPELDDADSHMLFITQERANIGGGQFAPKHRAACPEAFLFDNQLRIQVTWAEKIVIGDVTVGKSHHCRVVKNKCGNERGEFIFHTSNGRGDCPAGFDFARDVVEECKIRAASAGGEDFWIEREDKNGTVIVSRLPGGEEIRVRGEREFRRALREGLLDAYRAALDADIPRYLDTLTVGDRGEQNE